MNGDAPATIEKIGWTFIKWIIGLVIIFSILGIFFWAFFYSVYFANLSIIIPLRNWYQDTYWKTESLVFKPVRTYPPFEPIYTISVDKSDVPDAYTYSLWGTVSRVDTGGKTIYILGSDGNEYVFALTIYGLSFTGTAGKDFDQEGMAAFKGAKVLASWPDAKSLAEIKKAYEQNKTDPINPGITGGNLILKVFEK